MFGRPVGGRQHDRHRHPQKFRRPEREREARLDSSGGVAVAAGKTYEDTDSWTNSKVDDARLERFRENLLRELNGAQGADGSSKPVTAAIAHIARHSSGLVEESSSEESSSKGGRKRKAIEGQCFQGDACQALLLSRAILETHDGSLRAAQPCLGGACASISRSASGASESAGVDRANAVETPGGRSTDRRPSGGAASFS